MRSFNYFITLEIVIAILIALFIYNYNYHPIFYIKNYQSEDLYASLLSLDYLYYNQNVTNCMQINQSLYNIVSNIFPNYIVYINNTLAFNNTHIYNKGYYWLYIFSYQNGTTKNYITCYINIYT